MSVSEASKKLNIDQSNISKYCNGKQNSAGKHPNNPKIKLTWKYI
jgi:predicted transcriptional regulator